MEKYQTLKGFRDFLPAEAKAREWLKNKMVRVFEAWGYEPLETPTLEYLDLFRGQIGEDEKLFYQFKDLGGRQVALRYEQTVPTCRAIGNNYDQLTFPFRRYQIQPVFRADKPQKGRYREFMQSDLDIFGISSPLADAEIIAVTLDLYQQLGFKKVVALVNNRDLMKNIPYPAIAAIDKLKKIGQSAVLNEMKQKGISSSQAKNYLKKVKTLKPDKVITLIFEYLRKAGFPQACYRFEPTLARSFSYSQGPIWEIVIPEYKAGSVGGGERYDNLVEKITNKKIPGTGIGIGFERTLEAAQQLNLVPKYQNASLILVTVFNLETLAICLETARFLRGNNLSVEVYPDPKIKLEKQLKYADRKGIPWAVIIGPEEMKTKRVTLKNLRVGAQKTISQDNLVAQINSGD